MKKQYFIVAGCIIKNKKILLLHRIVGFKVRELPGGKIEFGESPEKAVVREIKEETNLKVKILSLLTIDSHISPQKDHYIFLHYICKILGGKLKINDKDHDDYKWFTFSELKKLQNLAISVRHILPELQKVI